MNTRAKEKPGTLEMVIGGVMLVAAPFALFAMGESDAALARMKAEGVVAEAVVKGKGERTESTSGRKGRTRNTTIYYVSVDHDYSAKTPYAEWKRTGTYLPSPYKAMTTSDIDVGSGRQEELAIGEKVAVIKLPLDSDSLMLVDQLEEETSLAYHLKWYLAMAAVFLGGIAVTIWGWRKRKAHG